MGNPFRFRRMFRCRPRKKQAVEAKIGDETTHYGFVSHPSKATESVGKAHLSKDQGEKMDQATLALVVASLSALVTAAGWIFVHHLSRVREDRTRRLQILHNYHERQIQEFYAPLYSSLHLISVGSEIYAKMISAFCPDGKEARDRFEEAFDLQYYKPIHDEIREIFKTKLYLMESDKVEAIYLHYLRHSQEEDMFYKLRAEKIDLSSEKRTPWKPDFPVEVKEGLAQARRNYRAVLNELELTFQQPPYPVRAGRAPLI
jgi:hypothetical protein